MKALGKLANKAAWALGVELVKQHDGYCDDDIEEAAGKAKKGKGLTPAAKAHIVAAQKARWAKIKAKK
jgi:hypothetical protein